MTFEEVRKILKEYYIEQEVILPYRTYRYKEENTLNPAFNLCEDYAWKLTVASNVVIYGEHIKYSTVRKDITDEVYDSEEKLRKYILELKDKLKLIKSQIKIKKLEKDFK